MNGPPLPLQRFLHAAWPDALAFPETCWVRRAIAHNPDDWATALEALEEGGGLDDLTRRVLAEHPADKAHLDAHDIGVRTAFTEAEAYAWGFRKGLTPKFVFNEGEPDLRIRDEGWIEAKTVRASDADRAEWESAQQRAASRGHNPTRVGSVAPLARGFRNKLDADLADARKKWHRSGGSTLCLFLCVSLDVPVDWNKAWRGIDEWAHGACDNGLRIVAIWNHNWEEPRVDVP